MLRILARQTVDKDDMLLVGVWGTENDEEKEIGI